jgi:type I restriction enzyme S subunit
MASAEPTAKAGWEVKTLGEVLSFEYGKPLPKEKRHESGAYPVFGANGIKARSNKYYHDKPSIVVGRKGSAGEVNLTGGPFWPLDVTFFVKFDDSRYNLKFLFNLLTSLNLPSFAKGVKPGINRNEVYALQSQFPPLPEQERIVGILDEAFEGIAAATAQAEKNLHNARELFQSVLQSTFSQKGDDWVETTLKEVCGITSKLADPKENEFIDLLHVGGANIESDSGELHELKTAREEQLISGKFPFNESMVLYSKIRPYLKKVSRPSFRGLCSADIYPLAPNAEILERDFLFHLLLTADFTDYAIKGSARAGMPKVNRPHLFAYSFNLPPLPTQQAIVEKLDALSEETKRLEAIYKRKQAALSELKQSLLQKAFAGAL